jgi:hypothetical protein
MERAIELARDPQQIASYKRRLSSHRSTCLLFNMPMLVDRLEQLFASMCRDYQEGRLSEPDSTNLGAYLEVGIDHDHDEQEMLSIVGYHDIYKAKLALLHRVRPLCADHRLWTTNDIAQFKGKQAMHTGDSSDARDDNGEVLTRQFDAAVR